MKTIWKYKVQVTDIFTIKNIPEEAQVLSVQIDQKDDMPYLWALVDDDNAPSERTFEVFGTGNPIPVDMGIERVYIGTFQQGGFVWHLFERL